VLGRRLLGVEIRVVVGRVELIGQIVIEPEFGVVGEDLLLVARRGPGRPRVAARVVIGTTWVGCSIVATRPTHISIRFPGGCGPSRRWYFQFGSRCENDGAVAPSASRADGGCPGGGPTRGGSGRQGSVELPAYVGPVGAATANCFGRPRTGTGSPQ